MEGFHPEFLLREAEGGCGHRGLRNGLGQAGYPPLGKNDFERNGSWFGHSSPGLRNYNKINVNKKDRPNSFSKKHIKLARQLFWE